MTGLAPDSSSISHQWKYDVFINFRGEDTRHGFTGNLYNALKKVGVGTFLDDEELRRGDEITPTLLNAIENSRMAITVFSKNYASSTFCLNELVHIHECIKRKGRLVWPIFYDVQPTVVRHQTGNYKKKLSMHMEKRRADEDKIQRWKHALHEVANISGGHFNPRQDYEYQFIERIVKEISSRINRVPLHVSEYPVGLEPRVKEITSLLQIGSNDKVIMVGICGMGGLGKTTIARALYNSIADSFEGLCFLHDVKEKSKKLGLERIQETILSKIVGVDVKIQDIDEGVQVIKKTLKKKKILLILDNVDNHKQLKKLAGGCNWFSSGSRIIITTRDKHLLVRHGVESIYNMKAFNAKESLELLGWNAFRNPKVDPHYKDVLNRAVTYAQGLPLALEVIGSNLCGKTINKWESALDTYKLCMHKDIRQVLRMSYEDLEEDEKEIFLDIACFFNGKNLEYVKDMVEAVYDSNNLSYSIEVLEDKSLLKIAKWSNCIEMHDLIRDMGRTIVREESLNNPGARSRLTCHQDIVNVLEGNMGTNKVRMIVQDNWMNCIKVNWDGEAFKSMKELKILIFKNVEYSEDPKYLPDRLKVLEWHDYPSSCLPPNFSAKKLVVLDMSCSCLSSLETIIKTSDNLGILNLESCKDVEKIPDLSNLKNLKKLNLRACRKLTEIHDSIGYLPKLEILDVKWCSQLKTFPRAIKLPSLTIFKLSHCSSLTYFPEILEKVKITELSLKETGIEKLPWSICNLSELRSLVIKEHWSVIEIPNLIFLLPEIQEIIVDSGVGKVISCNSKEAKEEAIWSKQYLNRVDLPYCNISDEILRTDLNRFMNVKYLNLWGNDFTILPVWMKECHFLETLLLNECKHLREVEGIPPCIRRLEATNCVSLSSESKSLLLSEELHGARGRYNCNSEEEPLCYFCVPSTSIPTWFDHRSKGASISFWFRNSFPTLCLCFLLKDVISDVDYFLARVKINEEPASYHSFPGLLEPQDAYCDDDHLVVYNLKEDDIRMFGKKGLRLIKHQWYHAQVYVESDMYGDDEGMVIEESGMYVIKQLCEMEDITFTNPYHQTLDSTWGNEETSDDEDDDEITEISDDEDDGVVDTNSNNDNNAEQVGTRMEEKEAAVNKKRRLMGDDNFAAVDNDTTPQVSFVKAREIITNNQEQVGTRMEEEEVAINKKRRLMGNDNFTSSSTAFICPINQDDNEATPQVPFVKACEIINNNQELQQQKDITSTNVEQVSKSFEDTRKAKGKEIVIYDNNINE